MLGVCCQWLEEKKTRTGVKYTNKIGEQALQLGRFQSGKYSDDHIASVWRNNISGLASIVPEIKSSGINMMRIGSTTLPLFDKLVASPAYSELVSEAKSSLATLGKQMAGMRLTMHPGQFVVLNSDSPEVIKNSIRELEYHAFIFDSLGVAQSQEYAINIHGGKSGNAELLVSTIKSLPDAVRKRLTLENDENCWSVKQLIPISEATGIPILFDSHHHVFNDDGMSGEEAMIAAAKTWPSGIRPLQHLSNTEPGLENGSFTERRQHSWAIKYIPEYQKNFYTAGNCDIEMECKGKNLGFIPYLDILNIKL